MGIFDTLKKTLGISNLPAVSNKPAFGDIVKYTGQTGTVMPKAAMIGPHTVPGDIVELLWFEDGPLKNYQPDNSKNKFEVGGLLFEISSRYKYRWQLDENCASSCQLYVLLTISI